MVAVDFQLIFLRFVFMSNFLSARIYVHIGKKNGRKMKKRKGLIKKLCENMIGYIGEEVSL